jgi:hypothetical protein
MLRRILLTGILGTGLFAGLALPAVTEAHERWDEHRHYEPRHVEPHFRGFEVMYRRDACKPWESYGNYRERGEADRAAEHLRCDGFQVDVRGC